METHISSLEGLLAPTSIAAFRQRMDGGRHLYIPGGNDKFSSVFSWDALNRQLAASHLWNAQTMKVVLGQENLHPNDYCTPGQSREGQAAQVPEWPRVGALLQKGATLVLDRLETLDPGIQKIAKLLRFAFTGVVNCNAYCSWQQKPAFRSHFDTQDVFALHIEGQKTWRLYEGRFDGAMEAEGYCYRSFPQEVHDRNKGTVVEEVTMTPGDLLYIPRGQYHDALAASDACLHISFGVTRPTGLDFVRSLMDQLTQDPAFRADLPDPMDRAGYLRHVSVLADLMHEAAADPSAPDRLLADQRRKLFEHLPDFGLPQPCFSMTYRVRSEGVKLCRRGQSWVLQTQDGTGQLDSDEQPMAAWILDRGFFGAREFAEQFAQVDEGTRRDLLTRLRGHAVIETC